MRFLRLRWLLLLLLVLGSIAAVYVFLHKQRLSADYLAEGHALARQGRHRSALGDFTLAILLSPNEHAGYLARARAYEALQMPAAAVEDLGEAIHRAPHDPELHFLRGLLLMEPLQRYAEAVRDFDTVIALRPGNAQAYYRRGRAYDLINNPHQAVKDYTRALELDPTLTEAWLERASIRGHFRETDLQIADLTAALRLRPDATRLYSQRGKAYMAKRAFAEALADFNRVLAVEHNINDTFQRGTANLNLRRFQAAIVDFTRVIRAHPYATAAYYNRARAYAALGDTKRAHDDWAAVCEIDSHAQTEACFRAQAGR